MGAGELLGRPAGRLHLHPSQEPDEARVDLLGALGPVEAVGRGAVPEDVRE